MQSFVIVIFIIARHSAQCSGLSRWDVNRPFVQSLHAVRAPGPSVPWAPARLSDGLPWHHGAYVQVTLTSLGNATLT